MATPVVEVRGLVNQFGHQVVHRGLDMAVQAGEVFGVVGGSGSGKSVLLRSIIGLQKPKAGTVRLLGRDITADDRRRAARASRPGTASASSRVRCIRR